MKFKRSDVAAQPKRKTTVKSADIKAAEKARAMRHMVTQHREALNSRMTRP